MQNFHDEVREQEEKKAKVAEVRQDHHEKIQAAISKCKVCQQKRKQCQQKKDLEEKRKEHQKQQVEDKIQEQVKAAEQYQDMVNSGQLPEGIGGPECLQCSLK